MTSLLLRILTSYFSHQVISLPLYYVLFNYYHALLSPCCVIKGPLFQLLNIPGIIVDGLRKHFNVVMPSALAIGTIEQVLVETKKLQCAAL